MLSRPRRATVSLAASCVCSIALLASLSALAQQPTPPAAPPPAPTIVQGKQLEEVQGGWSALDQLVGTDVRNDGGETIGTVEDLFVLPKTGVAYVIIDVGDFIGKEGHLVATPVSQLTLTGNTLLLKGATKETLKAAAAFAYPE